jgi:hypothetical protein
MMKLSRFPRSPEGCNVNSPRWNRGYDVVKTFNPEGVESFFCITNPGFHPGLFTFVPFGDRRSVR